MDLIGGLVGWPPPSRSLRERLPHCARATLGRPCSFGPVPAEGRGPEDLNSSWDRTLAVKLTSSVLRTMG